MAGKDDKKPCVPAPVARWLPHYYRYVNDLYYKGVVRVSSNSLCKKIGITTSQTGGAGKQSKKPCAGT